MPENPTRYNVLIASPGDVREDAFAVAEGLKRWSSIVGQKLNIDIHPLLWETDAIPETGRSPQTAIDEQLVDRADLTVAIFGGRIGTPINGHPSGTVAEIKRSLEQNKHVSVYFGPIKANACSVDINQVAELHKFAEWCKKESLYFEYNNTFLLCQLVQLHIQAKVIELHQRRQNESIAENKYKNEDFVATDNAPNKEWAELTEQQQQQYMQEAAREITALGVLNYGKNVVITRARNLHTLDKRLHQDAKKEIAASRVHAPRHGSAEVERALRRMPNEDNKK